MKSVRCKITPKYTSFNVTTYKAAIFVITFEPNINIKYRTFSVSISDNNFFNIFSYLFRPWWDSLEDFVIYGLIMLGLIVRKHYFLRKLTLFEFFSYLFILLFTRKVVFIFKTWSALNCSYALPFDLTSIPSITHLQFFLSLKT